MLDGLSQRFDPVGSSAALIHPPAHLHAVEARSGRPTADGSPTRAFRISPMALLWQEPNRPPQRLALSEGFSSLGSHADNSVILSDRQISRFHCRLHVREDGTVWLRDLNSKNGTLVDGARILEAELSPGARIQLGSQQLRLERASIDPGSEALPGMIARDPVMQPQLALLRRAAAARLPVILRGETGTGKEVAARALHAMSPRAQGPFVPVNCGAIAAELAESELFGHERGAFTGAVASSPGAFGAADGGTLFLDEIGELPLGLQVKLLRALESDEVKPVGAARTKKIDVRIVCATHRDLRLLVERGQFREDLYYRLQGVEIVLPPLRSRPRDLLAITEKLLAREGDGARLSPCARSALLAHRWPGNVRELVHSLRLALLLREGPLLRASDLQLHAAPSKAPERSRFSPSETSHRCAETNLADAYGTERASPDYREPLEPQDADDSQDPQDLPRTLEEIEERAIRDAYRRHGGRRRAIAEELGIAKSSLLRKLSSYGMRE